jgi:hypothetical protein
MRILNHLRSISRDNTARLKKIWEEAENVHSDIGPTISVNGLHLPKPTSPTADNTATSHTSTGGGAPLLRAPLEGKQSQRSES